MARPGKFDPAYRRSTRGVPQFRGSDVFGETRRKLGDTLPETPGITARLRKLDEPHDAVPGPLSTQVSTPEDTPHICSGLCRARCQPLHDHSPQRSIKIRRAGACIDRFGDEHDSADYPRRRWMRYATFMSSYNLRGKSAAEAKPMTSLRQMLVLKRERSR